MASTPINMIESADAHLEIAHVIRKRDKVHAREVAVKRFQMFSDQHLNLYTV